MRIDVRRLGEADLVLVEGVLDLATTPRLRAVLDARLAEGRHQLVLDLDRVRLLDAGAAGMFVGVADRAEKKGGALRAVGARGLSLEVLQIVSLDKRAHNPYLVASRLTDQPVPMPWLGNRRLLIRFA